MEKRGISALVATVLTILITVAGIVIIWIAIVPMINENIAFDELDGRVTILSSGGYTVYDADRDVAIVQVKRDVDEGVMNRIKIIFMIGGESVSSNVVAPDSGQVKTYSFDLSGYGEPESVSVAAIFVSESGKEKEMSVTSKVNIPSGKISEVDADVLELERDYFYEMPMTGLVSWWKFDGDATDSVGDNDGECINCPTYIDGAGVFDGVDDYVIIPDSASFDLSDFSMSFWTKAPDTTIPQSIIRQQDGSPNYLIAYLNSDGKILVSLKPGTGGVSNFQSNDAVDDDLWHFVTFTVNPGVDVKIYIDDKAPATASYSESTPFSIGDEMFIGSYIGGYQFFNGSIDNVMIFDKVLGEDEITAIYENQKK